jgi:precorrin-2 dehydrogenase/sirohydrochlorin ferrochelatase
MRYYPINLDLQNRNCLVVGGGPVSTRKVKTLLECGAKVTVVSPVVTNPLRLLSRDNSIILKEKPYQPADLDGMLLVIGATDNEALNQQISTDARDREVLCNIADRPEICDFILPSIVHRGDLVIAISTSGKSPAFAKKLRKDLEKEFGNEYAEFLRLMGAIRNKLLSANHDPEAHKHLFEKIITQGLLELIRDGNTEKINYLLLNVLGKGYDFEGLLKTKK